jgi:hypothetical protein
LCRELLDAPRVAAAENDIVGHQGQTQASHDVINSLSPFLFAHSFQPAQSHVIVESPLFPIGEMRQLQRNHGLADDHRRAQTGSQPKK